MLNLIDQTELAEELTKCQKELLGALRQEGEQCIFLKEYVSIPRLQAAAEAYMKLIVNEMEAIKEK